MANALRRTMIADVPTLAIDVVQIKINKSVSLDPFIAHRLGLIPIDSAEAEQLKTPDECTCAQANGCPECSAAFLLDVCNTSNELLSVTEKDLVFDPASSVLQNLVPATKQTPIMKLAPGQQLSLTAIVKKGTGRQNAKWQPVCVSSLKPLPLFKIQPQQKPQMGTIESKNYGVIPIEDIDKIVDCCPQKVFAKRNNQLQVINPDNCDFCNECQRVVSPSVVKITPSESQFIITIESTGQLSPIEIFLAAIRARYRDLCKLEESLNEILQEQKS